MIRPRLAPLLTTLWSFGAASAQPTQPGPPASGPGSLVYPHQSYDTTQSGDGALAFYVYEPAQPTPASASVVVFMHGYNGTNPAAYISWIEHLARRGSSVIFPVYQTGPGGVAAY